MKTAMKRMLDYIQAIQDDNFNSDIEYIKENCIQLIDLEKQQHEQIAIDMVNTCLNNPGVNMEEEFKKYYNERFN